MSTAVPAFVVERPNNPGRVRVLIVEICLQTAHRITIMAFLALFGVILLVLKAGHFEPVVVITGGCGLFALGLAWTALLCCHDDPSRRREARGIMVFNGVIAGVVLVVMFMTRLTYIRIEAKPLTDAPTGAESLH